MADKPTTSAAKELGPDFQAESLKTVAPIRENFQDKADPTYSAQVEAMRQNEVERAEGSGSQMVTDDGNRHNMNPPAEMREAADRQAFDAKWDKEKLLSDLEDKAKFDKEYENESDYENDM